MNNTLNKIYYWLNNFSNQLLVIFLILWIFKLIFPNEKWINDWYWMILGVFVGTTTKIKPTEPDAS